MWFLARILPLLVGDFVDEEEDQHWHLYLQLMDITDLIFCAKGLFTPKLLQFSIPKTL